MVENAIVLNETVTYHSEYQRDLQYHIAVQTVGHYDYGRGAFKGYIWAVLMKRCVSNQVKLLITFLKFDIYKICE